MGDVGGGPPPDDELSTSDRAELERLRGELEGLRVEVADLEGRTHGHAAARFGRWSAATVMVVVAALVFGVSVVAVYVRGQLLNTDRYVAMVAPLARDPAVQAAITNRLTDEFMTKLDVQGLVQQAATDLQQKGAPPLLNSVVGPVTDGVRTFVSTLVQKVVTSDQFAQFWDRANRVAHQEVTDVLTTGQGQFLTANGTQVSLDVGSILTMAKQRLVDNGFTLAQKVPDTSITVPLFQAKNLPRIRTAVTVLDTLAWVLPLVALVLLGLAVLVSPNRRRGLVLGATTFAVVLLIMLAALAILRTYYLNHLPDTSSPDAARVNYDTAVRLLVQALETLVVLFVIVAVLCWAFGPSRPARLLQRGGDAVLDLGGRGLARTGLPLGPVPAFLRRWRVPIVVVVAALTIMGLVLWETPGISGVIGLTVSALAFLALVEVVARAAHPGAPVPSPA
jgi:hypothetical protein